METSIKTTGNEKAPIICKDSRLKTHFHKVSECEYMNVIQPKEEERKKEQE